MSNEFVRSRFGILFQLDTGYWYFASLGVRFAYHRTIVFDPHLATLISMSLIPGGCRKKSYRMVFNLLQLSIGNRCPYRPIFSRTDHKIIFRPNIFVGVLFQIDEIREYVCTLKQDAAASLNRNPNVEMGSMNFFVSIQEYKK